MHSLKNFLLLIICLISFYVYTQPPTGHPLELRDQFNGQYDFTVIGNTFNLADNQSPFNTSCQLATSSSATLDLEANQTIEAAYLYWSGVGDGTFQPTITLNNNNITPEELLVVDPEQTNFFFYFGAVSEITQLVENTGNGSYSITDFDLNPILSNFNYCGNGIEYAGWSIVVVYSDTSLSSRQVSIYDGFVSLDDDSVTSEDLEIANFEINNTGNSKLGVCVYNGSPFYFLGESLQFNNNTLSNFLNPPDNPFNGTNSYTGSTDLYNMDLDQFDVSSYLDVGDTSATITFESFLFRFLQNAVLSVPSELPEPTVNISPDQSVFCESENVSTVVEVENTNATAALPANAPVELFYEDTNGDLVLLQSNSTLNPIPIDGSESFPVSFAIPADASIPLQITARVNLQDDGSVVFNENNPDNNFFSTTIEIVQPPILNNSPVSLSVCGNISTGESIDLTQNDLITLGLDDPDALNIQYFTSNNDAQNANNAIPGPENFVLSSDPQDIFIRIENAAAPACFTTDNFTVAYEDTPEIQQTINLHQCQQDNTPITFDLTTNDATAIGVDNPANANISYHETLPEAQNDVNPISAPANYQPLNDSQSIFIRAENTENPECFSTASFEINTFTAIINNVNDLNIQACIFPGESASFDLTENSAIALGNQDPADYNITYHLNAADAQNGNNAITDPTDYDNLSNPQDIWLRLDNNAAPIDCFSTAQFTISVANAAPINFSPDPLQVCDADNDGFTEFDLTQSISDISSNNPDIDITFHLSLSDAENNTNALSSPFTNTVADDQTLFFRTEESGNGCSFTGSLELEVFATPDLDASQPTLSACSVNADTATFDLTAIDEQIILNGDTTNFDSAYYLSESDALSDTNAIQNPTNYINTSDPQTLWIRVSDEDNCSSVAAFQLDVLTGAALTEDPPGSLEVCSQQRDALFAQVDLTQLDSAINANPDAPTLVEYFTALSAVDNENPIENPQNFNVSGASTTVFARVVQVETLCVSEVLPIELIINPLPQVDLSAYDGQVICTDAASGEVINNDFSPPIINTGLSDAEFDFSWQRNGEAISADTSSLTVDQPGDYQVVATNIDTGCEFSSTASIEESSIPDFEVEIISPPFSRNPIVEVRNISGSGSFEFRLDDGNWVSLGNSDSLRFSGFQFGEHEISGRDLLGCGIRIKDFQVIGYQSFFTPNQDGHNDRWNIPSLKNQRDALVLIYDRYGKLLYKFRPGEAGWDGTYNGKALPSNDYWFSVQYTDPRTGKQSIFRGNITLKR